MHNVTTETCFVAGGREVITGSCGEYSDWEAGTRDEAKRIEESRKGKTTDGASDVAITESARRRQDLLPGSGHHGLIYSMAVSVTGRNEDDALRAGTRVEQAADNCGIGEIVWQDNRHDVAAFLTLPLGRGLAATKWTRIKTRG